MKPQGDADDPWPPSPRAIAHLFLLLVIPLVLICFWFEDFKSIECNCPKYELSSSSSREWADRPPGLRVEVWAVNVTVTCCSCSASIPLVLTEGAGHWHRLPQR